MFLEDAVATARSAAEERMRDTGLARLKRAAAERYPLDFEAAVTRSGNVRVIAEVKRRSPSAGPIREAANVSDLVRAYRDAGASAVSVLTSGYRFGGALEDLDEAAAASPVTPLLAKDFIVDPCQVLEARARGASAVLLIASALPGRQLVELASYAAGLGLAALVEAHDENDLERALACGSRLIGINNRDLASLEVDVATTERLLARVPPGFVVVSESGIKTREQVEYLEGLGVDAVLIGEALMRSEDPGATLSWLLGRRGAAPETHTEEVDESCGSRSAGLPGSKTP